jgi:hypothetical protein
MLDTPEVQPYRGEESEGRPNQYDRILWTKSSSIWNRQCPSFDASSGGFLKMPNINWSIQTQMCLALDLSIRLL